MKTFVSLLFVLMLGLAACESGTQGITLPTAIPPELATGIAQAPTIAAQAAGTTAAIGSAAQTAAVPVATQAAGAISTAAPFAKTAVSGAQTSVAPVQTAIASITPPASAGAVQVQLSDTKIDMPASLKTGALLFVVKNNGSAEHNFQIQGPSVDKKLEANLKPGETGTLLVQLAPGTYKVFDPTGDYQNQGMRVNLTITP